MTPILARNAIGDETLVSEFEHKLQTLGAGKASPIGDSTFLGPPGHQNEILNEAMLENIQAGTKKMFI